VSQAHTKSGISATLKTARAAFNAVAGH